MLGSFSLFTYPCDMNSLFLKGEQSYRSDYKQAHGAETKVMVCSANQLTVFYMVGTLAVKGLTRDLMVFAISFARISYFTSKSLIHKI